MIAWRIVFRRRRKDRSTFGLIPPQADSAIAEVKHGVPVGGQLPLEESPDNRDDTLVQPEERAGEDVGPEVGLVGVPRPTPQTPSSLAARRAPRPHTPETPKTTPDPAAICCSATRLHLAGFVKFSL